MNDNAKIWIYDLEQFPNFHSATFLNRDNLQEIRKFVIFNDDHNDAYALYKFYKEEVKGLIGFNNVNYDYPLVHFFMQIMSGYDENTKINPRNLNNLLYEENERLIKEQYTAIYENETLIPQLDLYRIHHFDNKAKATSLKAVEIAINFENVQDLPFSPDYWVKEEDIPLIMDYNENDVKATYEFYLLTKDLIDLRKKLGKKYNINLLNANDPKMGQEIFGRQIARKKGWSYSYLKDLRTYRHSINLNNCILPHIKFRSKEFNKLLDELKSTIIETTYKAFEKSVIYKGFKYDYGTGGIHGCIEPGIYESDNEYIIIDIDVEGYYPNLAISNNFYPQHLGLDFIEVYKDIVAMKEQAAKEGDKTTRSAMKLASNGAFGKSNDKFSLFYDPKYTMQITINGQLFLSMLAEDIVDTLTIREDEVQILQINTDGITIRIHRKHEQQLHSICEDWEKTTKLKLEYASYSKMVIRDVNNYFAVTVEGKYKYKGCFEIIPMQNGAIAYNKDWSMRVVPKALEAYYTKGIPVEDFIRNHNDIYDFCLGFRARSDWKLKRIFIEDGLRKEERLQKTIRYYISTNGDSILKQSKETGKIIQLEAGFASTLFNKYIKKDNFADYKINYSYYIAEANKIKYAVNSGQLKLF